MKNSTRQTKPASNSKEASHVPYTSNDAILPSELPEFEFEDLVSRFKAKSEHHKSILELIQGDPDIFTGKGRLNKTRVCQTLGIKQKELNKVLEDAKEYFAEGKYL